MYADIRDLLPMPIRRKNDRIPVTLTLHRKLKEQLDQMARLTKRTRSAYVELALELQLRIDGAR